ncbi:hypothetical protein BT63DRAFT_423124 [Microthyrium microscopicum]|uniref:EthD domain-containing protein n=1 Tax=Microthyrium microscopicum TaxID=703497 RepID=A0A6A6UG93_9PEZI|nr:hypothetical protein BT63DRAFT_423124 [Microthyrium microscopicum]
MSEYDKNPHAPNGKQSKLIKITEYLKKLPNITDEQFHQHWNSTHVNIAMKSPLFRKHVRYYNQFHITPEDRALAAKLGPVLEYDGVVELWMDSMEDWEAIVADKEFLATIFPDEKKFLQTPVQFMIGRDTLVIPYNESNEDAKDMRIKTGRESEPAEACIP